MPQDPFADLKRDLQKLLRDAPKVAGAAATSHFKDNITKRQGMPINGRLQRFGKRVPGTPRDSGRNILVDSGRMVRAIGIISTSSDSVQVGIGGAESDYANIHNEGGTITVEAKMIKYFWAMYYKATKGIKKLKSGKASKSKKNVGLSQEAQFWKGMALKKPGSLIKIPKRQFIADTPDVEIAVSRALEKEADKILSKY